MPAESRYDLVGGVFKIKAPFKAVQRVVEVLVYDNRFERIQLRVSGTRKNEPLVAIDFLYKLDCAKDDEEGGKREKKIFFEKLTDGFRREFGNGLIAWDVSTPVMTILS